MPRVLGFVVFLAVAIAIVAGMHYYLWARLVRDVGFSVGVRRGLTVVVIVLAVLMPAGMAAERLLPRPWAKPLAELTYGWMGLGFLLFVAVGFADLARALFGLAASARGDELADTARRVFLARAVAGTALLAGGAGALAGIVSANTEVAVHEVPVKLPRLPPELSGLTIVQLTDLHAGPIIGERHVRALVESTNALKPDLVALTGDFVDGVVPRLGHALAPLKDLESRYGSFFVTGNHEYYSGVDAWIAYFEKLGVRVLRNERVTVGDAKSIDLAGLDDWHAHGFPGHGPNLGKALAGRDPDRALVLLEHQPKGVAEAVKAGVGLQVSGHTHGGQIWPFSGIVRIVYPYLAGLYTVGDGQVFVSRGVGYWGPPMRLFAPPEIAKIVLT